jgi:hypothetical protein
VFDWLLNRLRKRQSLHFLEDSHAWYQACTAVSRACADALSNESIAETDIGVVLDRTDRTLFGLRSHAAGIRRPLRQRNAALARRVADASEQIFRLRNQTSRFLIRCQGPLSPAIVNDPEGRRVHYTRAMQDFGLEARRMQRELEMELQSIWREMQSLRLEAERLAANQP